MLGADLKLTILEYVKSKIEASFKDQPYKFFTEHDIHTELAFLAKEYLSENEKLVAKTEDGFLVNRVHHEYPTPFRCIMRNYDFEVVPEEEFNQKRKALKGFSARRGFIDLVVLNSDFIKSNTLVVVSGKRYKKFLSSLKNQKYPMLDLAIEVVYHPTFDKKPHKGIMQSRVKSTIQDYKKLIALKDYRFPNGFLTVKEVSMLFFSNTIYENELNSQFENLVEDKRVPIYKIISH